MWATTAEQAAAEAERRQQQEAEAAVQRQLEAERREAAAEAAREQQEREGAREREKDARLREMREHTQRILTAGKDRHRMLGVEVGATAAEVRRAYIRISGRINTSSATYIQAGQRGLREEQAAAVEAFKRLADAKEALMDPESSPAKIDAIEAIDLPAPSRFESLVTVYRWYRWTARTFIVYKRQQCKNCSQTRCDNLEKYAERWSEGYCTYCHAARVREPADPESPKPQRMTCHGGCQRRYACKELAYAEREDGTSGHFCQDCNPWGPNGEARWTTPTWGAAL